MIRVIVCEPELLKLMNKDLKDTNDSQEEILQFDSVRKLSDISEDECNWTIDWARISTNNDKLKQDGRVASAMNVMSQLIEKYRKAYNLE